MVWLIAADLSRAWIRAVDWVQSLSCDFSFLALWLPETYFSRGRRKKRRGPAKSQKHILSLCSHHTHQPSIGQIKVPGQARHQGSEEIHTAHLNGRAAETLSQSLGWKILEWRRDSRQKTDFPRPLCPSTITRCHQVSLVIFLFLSSIPNSGPLRLTYCLTQ